MALDDGGADGRPAGHSNCPKPDIFIGDREQKFGQKNSLRPSLKDFRGFSKIPAHNRLKFWAHPRMADWSYAGLPKACMWFIGHLQK
jgi:hypothetical protein